MLALFKPYAFYVTAILWEFGTNVFRLADFL